MARQDLRQGGRGGTRSAIEPVGNNEGLGFKREDLPLAIRRILQRDGALPPEERFSLAIEDYLLEGPSIDPCSLNLLMTINSDFVNASKVLVPFGPWVTVFGSARPEPGSHWYERTQQVGREIANANYTVMTGGGPGLMEAANRGAKEAGGRSVGCNIELPHEQSANPYCDAVATCKNFAVRKMIMMLRHCAVGIVAMPGGFGTFDELFESLTLVQTKKESFPVVLMGREYFQPMIKALRKTALAERFVAPEDLNNLMLTDDPAEAAAHIVASRLH